MLKLGVNIDHVATLREARYRGRPRGEPDPVAAALACEAAGAVSTAALLAGVYKPEPGSTVLAVVSGGNVAPRTASGILDPDEG